MELYEATKKLNLNEAQIIEIYVSIAVETSGKTVKEIEDIVKNAIIAAA